MLKFFLRLLWWNSLTDPCIQEYDPTCVGAVFPRLSPSPPIPLQPLPFTTADRNLFWNSAACVCVLKHRHLTFVDLPLTPVMPCVCVFNIEQVALAGHLLSYSLFVVLYPCTSFKFKVLLMSPIALLNLHECFIGYSASI